MREEDQRIQRETIEENNESRREESGTTRAGEYREVSRERVSGEISVISCSIQDFGQYLVKKIRESNDDSSVSSIFYP